MYQVLAAAQSGDRLDVVRQVPPLLQGPPVSGLRDSRPSLTQHRSGKTCFLITWRGSTWQDSPHPEVEA